MRINIRKFPKMPKIYKNVFTPNVTKQALQIMKRIAQRPCAKPFLDDFCENTGSINKIIEPVCISMIIQRLEINDYKNPSEWQHDMKLIPQNCATLYGSSGILTTLANRLYHVFEKEFELFVSFSVNRWSKLVGILSHQLIFKMNQKMPKELRYIIETNATLLQGYPFIPNLTSFPLNENYDKSYQNSIKYDQNLFKYDQIPNNHNFNKFQNNSSSSSYSNHQENNNNYYDNKQNEIHNIPNKNKNNSQFLNNNQIIHNNDDTSSSDSNDHNNIIASPPFVKKEKSSFIESILIPKNDHNSNFHSHVFTNSSAIRNTNVYNSNSNNSVGRFGLMHNNENNNNMNTLNTSYTCITKNVHMMNSNISKNENYYHSANNALSGDSDEEPIILNPKERARHEEACFLRALDMLKSKNDARAIVELILSQQPDLEIEEPNPIIVYDDLNQSTIHCLIEYVKKRFKELGEKYPK
ncbi:hypothetical protein TRFO_01025 [Tritrichomonas foetus]|uniref:Bromo domain-containing protein n=1 Tax=Tritrichomonas foetus TaxID=1144522 RepID=A0A1J4L6S5_9EUKA|nr:hypothetical protein TRFO_01025 [Tritrichomonas foetus]|eukprot:OHT17708.1 hypothetical protein TRFO_01025 [Tritrichomonas foetus]